ncbi:MAG TPA: hypothetical protein VMS09_07715 [Paenibacillus sp.]|uniref:hypothetical protein n=1 Tax=Paenibacillus sp. TaxID=58172 RepID=UPI0028D430C2|nr:hypothetical protein [Paenibacillus sp.]HUC91899.1 hypothetical protein [Paenibacillus sp.]
MTFMKINRRVVVTLVGIFLSCFVITTYFFFYTGHTGAVVNVLKKNINESYIVVRDLKGEEKKIRGSNEQIALIEENKQYFISYEYNYFRKPYIVRIQNYP